MSTINPQEVSAVFEGCLFQDGEPTEEAVKAEGITLNVGFHPERLQENKGRIRVWLDELPVGFRKDEGGGWSFLQACMTRNDQQWTGEHRVMEQLFLLGIAAGYVTSLMPREMWQAMPGGMPYYAVDTRDKVLEP